MPKTTDQLLSFFNSKAVPEQKLPPLPEGYKRSEYAQALLAAVMQAAILYCGFHGRQATLKHGTQGQNRIVALCLDLTFAQNEDEFWEYYNHP